MSLLYLASFVAGLLLAVRHMFFGAERRRARRGDALVLRRSEPALIGFLVVFGAVGYLLATRTGVSPLSVGVTAALLALLISFVLVRLALAAARMQPEHDPDDPRFVFQGRVATVTRAIRSGGEGMVRLEDGSGVRELRAREIADAAIASGAEVCIERVDDEVAFVERWSVVEARL